MSQNNAFSRRQVLTGSLTAGLGLVVLGAGCKKADPVCTDVTGLAEGDALLRTTVKYVDLSTDPAKNCVGCAQYKVGAPDACGSCLVVKGPINPKGNCTLWTAKPAS